MALIITTNKQDKEKEYERLRKKNIGTVNYTMRVPKDIHQALREKLVKDRITFKDLIMKTVDKYLKS
jgi:hypothetical protein